MDKLRNKNLFKDFIKKINEIDINEINSSLQSFKLEDLKNIDVNQISSKIKNSPILKPSIGLIGASLLFIFFLLPSLDTLISSFNKSKQYQFESNQLELKKKELSKKQIKYKKSTALMMDINQSIITKDKLIFITKLINETAINSNVQISSFIPIQSAKSAKLCQQSNKSNILRVNRRRKKSTQLNKGNFEDNFFEINLKSDYLNIIEFLNKIQYYDVTIIPLCLQVSSGNSQKSINLNKNSSTNNTTIIPISETGVRTNSSDELDEPNQASSYEKVKSRLVLKIPSHLR
tara:strand:+ start:286 stop:1155 length:870 start_codon:yes stop_codon:yes gene_type:complete